MTDRWRYAKARMAVEAALVCFALARACRWLARRIEGVALWLR